MTGNPSCLNEEQYGLLCEACDKILLDSTATPDTIAISWLHVVREHPVFLLSYRDIFWRSSGLRHIIKRSRYWVTKQSNWIRQIIRMLRSGGQEWLGGQTLPSRADIIFISHLIDSTHAGKDDDFYYGALPNEMVQNNLTVAIALINHTTYPSSYYNDKWKGCVVPRVIFTNSLGLKDERYFKRRLEIESRRLRAIASKARLRFDRIVLNRAAIEATSESSQRNLRIASQINTLVGQLNPKAIIITYEGHAWERMAFAATRLAVPGIKCIGYQHAALFRLQHAIRRNLAPEYNPDHIMTSGPAGKAELELLSEAGNISVSVLGSNRGRDSKVMLDGEMINTDKMFPTMESACLVLPEGIESECHLLFEFSIDCALSAPDFLFIWRLHPIVSFESLISQNSRLQKLPDNILISRDPFEMDIVRCGFALYRGTTAIVQAVFGGLRPIYLQKSDEMTIDPLYRMNRVRANVSTSRECLDIIKNDNKQLLTHEDKISAIQCCADLFVPFEAGALRKLVSG